VVNPNPVVRSSRTVQCPIVNPSARPDLWIRICHWWGWWLWWWQG